MCVPADLNGCPVMDVWSNGVAAPAQGGDTGTEGGSLKFAWTKVPTVNNLPIAELAISVNEVCKNDNDSPKTPANQGNYKLRRTGTGNQASCEGGTDSSFDPFFSMRFTDFLKVNEAWPTTDIDLQNSYSVTDDLKFFLSLLKQRNITAEQPIYISGKSLGANVVLKALGEMGDSAVTEFNIQGAAVGCVPFDNNRNQKFLQTGFSKLVYN